MKVSIDLHGREVREREVLVDITLQEKNVTFPTDTKLFKLVIDNWQTFNNRNLKPRFLFFRVD